MNIQKLIRPNIRNLRPYVCARHNEAKGIQLDANENPYGNVNRYPDPNATEIKKTLAKMLNVKMENIFVGNGSDEAIDILMRVFCSPGEEIITLDPTYGMYKVAADINDLKAKSVLLTKDFQIDVENTIANTGQKTKMIFMCSPNNPTANLLNKESIFEICQRFEGIVVVDEAYIEFAGDRSLVEETKRYPNLVILRTLSKAWGGAGIRVGYAVGPEEIIREMNKVKAPYNISVLDQKEALKILKNKKSMERGKTIILSERDRMFRKLTILGLKVYQSDANFILLEIPQANSIQKILQRKGVIIRDRSNMPMLENCLRVSVGSKKENTKFIKTLEGTMVKVAFIDRDGVILNEPQTDFQIDSLEKYKILPGVRKALKKLRSMGYKLVMVSNQDGLGTKSFPKKNFLLVQNRMIKDLGVDFDAYCICPHRAEDNCECRKPKIGLVKNFLKNTPINYKKSFVIGDRESDIQFAKNIGVKGVKAKLNSNSLLEFVNKLTS